MEEFVKCIKVSDDYIEALIEGVANAFDKQDKHS